MSIATGWAEDHIALSDIAAIGDEKSNSLAGRSGSQFWIKEWGYPPIGVYFGSTPTAGHEMIALDYRACGPQGEPSVVYVDQEDDYSIVPVAPSFEVFIKGLVSDSH